MSKKQPILIFLLATGLASVASAEEGRWYINPAIGLQDFDSERNLDNATTYSIGAEYRFNNPWAAELRLLDSSADSKVSDTDVNQYYLDALYYFKPMTARWQPFAVLGMGHAEFDGKLNDSQETQANAGIGVRYTFNDNWSLRGDLRGLYSIDDDSLDSLVTLGVSYAFGGNTPSASVPALSDADKDGVSDNKDQCPDTPEGRKVDDKGCKIALTKDISMKLSVNFSTNSDEVKGQIDNLDEVVKFLKAYPEVPVEIAGHTDDTGSAEYNKSLSQRRADAVRNTLINQYGIASDSIFSVGYGEGQPTATNTTAEGRAANRRVEATLKHTIKE